MKRTLEILVGISILLCSYTALVSQQTSYTPTYYIDTDGTIYWNKDLPVYISVSPYPDGQGTQLKSKNPDHSNPIYLDTEGVNYIRTKYAVDKNTKKVVSPLQEVLMPVVADGEGPNTNLFFKDAERSSRGNNKYFGPNLSIELNSTDKHSGVQMIMYNINGQGYTPYNNNIPISTIGANVIRYYAVDMVGNQETPKEVEFYVDVIGPSITHNINGMADGNIISTASKIYFESSDDLSGVDIIKYRFDDDEFKTAPKGQLKFSQLEDGDHTLEYYAIDEVGNSSSPLSVSFYYDKTAPITASDVLGDRFVVNDKVYFSGRTKMKLTAVDNKIGVKAIMYSIDSKKFEEYDQPFYLPTIPGEHSIRYYSLDRLANKPTGSENYKHNISLVYLDLTGPELSHDVKGPSFKLNGRRYIGPSSALTIRARDKESGLKMITYSLDGSGAENQYTEPLKFESSGRHRIEIFGYDNVSNRNISEAEVYVDRDAPTIFETFSSSSTQYIEGKNAYPSYVTLFLSATDAIVGTARIDYSVNGKTAKRYTKPITGFVKNKAYSIEITATDMVGNKSSKVIEFITTDD